VTRRKGTSPPAPLPVDGYINGLPVAVTQRSSEAAEIAVIAGLYSSEGEK
jgi:hypothetical protein